MILLLVGAAMIGGGLAVPEAGAGLIGAGIGCLLGGLLLTYLGFPSRGKGGERAKARVLGIERQPGGVAGYPIVKLDLEVRPKGHPAYQVTRKFTAFKLRKLEVGKEINVRLADPANPEKIDLA
ncbi:MAG: hypothetical protein ACRDL6_05430 [Solirubrobacterales bacterium]